MTRLECMLSCGLVHRLTNARAGGHTLQDSTHTMTLFVRDKTYIDAVRSCARTHRLRDSGVYVCICKYIMYICIHMHIHMHIRVRARTGYETAAKFFDSIGLE